MDNTLIALIGQIFISLYPILIKRSNATLPQQLAGRFGIFTLLPLILGGTSILQSVFGSFDSVVKTLAAGAVNILHVFESYKSFQLLPAGPAYTIIYTYPFWNLIGARIFLGEAIPTAVLPLFLLAFIGILLIASAVANGKQETNRRGLIAAFTGAITESILFLIVRGSESMNPFENIGRLYIGAAGLLATGTSIFSPNSIKEAIATPKDVPLFNALIGFTSMTALIWSAKRIPTFVYSLIAFIGLVASYGWGLLFANEVPSGRALLGSAIIGVSVLLLQSHV